MSKLQALEKSISALSAEELAKFRQWFADFDAAAWDRQIERDIKAGKLDALADQALRHHSEGCATQKQNPHPPVTALAKRMASAAPVDLSR